MSTAVSAGILRRRFGVELEFHFKGHEGASTTKATQLLTEHGFYHRRIDPWNNVGYDGSGAEVRSPILQGRDGLRDLKAVVDLFVKNGGATNSADGLHVHHDAPEFVNDKKLCEILVDSWKANEKHIDKFVAARRRTSGACPKWSEAQIRAFKAAGGGGDAAYRHGPRGALNLGALREHGSIEIRLHEGTLKWAEIEAWIMFGQRFLNYVVRRERLLKAASTSNDLLKALSVPDTASSVLKKKARLNRVGASKLSLR